MTLRPITADSQKGNVPLPWKKIWRILNEEAEMYSWDINKVEGLE